MPSISDPNEPEIFRRTRAFARRIIKVYCALPKRRECMVIADQLLRSGTSVGAQHREARRARTDSEFVSKLNSALQELEETMYWIELLVESEQLSPRRLQPLYEEAKEIRAIFITAINTVKRRSRVK